VRETVRRSGLYARLGADRFHLDPHEAVVQVLRRWDAQDEGSRVQRYLATTDPEKKAATPAAS